MIMMVVNAMVWFLAGLMLGHLWATSGYEIKRK